VVRYALGQLITVAHKLSPKVTEQKYALSAKKYKSKNGWSEKNALYLQFLESHKVLERPPLDGVDLVVHKLPGRQKSRDYSQ
jgi:hypothetical protein